MAETLESLRDLVEKHEITIADLEFIVEYLVQEKISPQLAMRRIKSFEILKSKLEDNKDQEIIKELGEQLVEQEKTLKEQLEEKEKSLMEKLEEQQEILKKLIKEKTAMEKEKTYLEDKSELFDSEREELRDQLKIMQEMHSIEPEQEGNEGIIKTISHLMHDLEKIITDKDDLTPVLLPVHDILASIIAEPDTYHFDVNEYLESIVEFSAISSTIESVASIPEKPSEKKIEAAKETVTTTVEKKKPTKPDKKKPKVDKKTIQILNLFLDFISEASTDKNFQDRIATISEMDEAYEHLGSIGLSQVYSFVSKGIERKEELIKLLNQWKKEGVPR